jgi:hypothetical protein
MRVGVNGIQGPSAQALWQMLSARTYGTVNRLTGADARFPYANGLPQGARGSSSCEKSE